MAEEARRPVFSAQLRVRVLFESTTDRILASRTRTMNLKNVAIFTTARIPISSLQTQQSCSWKLCSAFEIQALGSSKARLCLGGAKPKEMGKNARAMLAKSFESLHFRSSRGANPEKIKDIFSISFVPDLPWLVTNRSVSFLI